MLVTTDFRRALARARVCVSEFRWIIAVMVSRSLLIDEQILNSEVGISENGNYLLSAHELKTIIQIFFHSICFSEHEKEWAGVKYLASWNLTIKMYFITIPIDFYHFPNNWFLFSTMFNHMSESIKVIEIFIWIALFAWIVYSGVVCLAQSISNNLFYWIRRRLIQSILQLFFSFCLAGSCCSSQIIAVLRSDNQLRLFQP